MAGKWVHPKKVYKMEINTRMDPFYSKISAHSVFFCTASRLSRGEAENKQQCQQKGRRHTPQKSANFAVLHGGRRQLLACSATAAVIGAPRQRASFNLCCVKAALISCCWFLEILNKCVTVEQLFQEGTIFFGWS